MSRHLGDLKATQELVELCLIDRGNHVLDVGCGIGRTPCYIAKRLGCDAVGVDISEKMIERSRKRARSEGVQDRTEFRVADAQNLPFGTVRSTQSSMSPCWCLSMIAVEL